MPSKSVIELLQLGHNTASKVLPLIPLNIHKRNNRYIVINKNVKWSTKIIWTFGLLISFVVTLLEIYYSLYHSQLINLVTVFYHVFLALSKIAGFISAYVHLNKQQEHWILLNCFCTHPRGLVAYSCKSPLKPNNNLFPILLTLVIFTVLIFYAAILPTVIVLFPSLHADFIPHLFTGINRTSIIFRFILLLLHGPFMLVVGVFAHIHSALCLVTLHEITNDLLKLW